MATSSTTSTIRPKDIEKSVLARFASVDEEKRALEERLDSINDERNQLLNNTMQKEVSDAYLTSHFSEFATFTASDDFLRETYGERSTYTDEERAKAKRLEFISKRIEMDTKLAIIAEHRNTKQIYTGGDKFSADLADTQKIKSERKIRYKKDAEELMEHYQSILEDSEKAITSVESEITSKKDKIAEAESAITALLKMGAGEDLFMNGSTAKTRKVEQADIQAQKEALEKKIETWQKEIATLQKKLNQLREIHNQCVTDFATRKNEVTTLLEKGKIFNGAEQQGTIDEASKAEKVASEGTALVAQKQTTSRSIAESMLKDFFNRSPEEQRTILAQCGSKDLLNATQHLGVGSRRKLARVLEARIEEMDTDLDFNGVKVRKEELKGRSIKLSPEQLQAVAKEIREFNDHFDQKTPDEIKAFEEKIQYIRYASYMQETGWFRNLTRRFDFISRFAAGNRRFRTGEISKSLALYSTLKDARERNQLNQLNKWRKTLKLNPMNDLAITNPRALDRTGTDAIMTQNYVQEERDD